MDYAFVAWNKLTVVYGSSIGTGAAHELPLDWRPALIRNCSHSPAANCLGISGEDLTTGESIVGIFDIEAAETVHRFPFEAVLKHAVSPSGAWACVATPSATSMTADLELIEIATGNRQPLIAGGAHHGSTLSWFPDEERIAFQSADHRIQVVNRLTGAVLNITDGIAPSVSPEGDRIAFRRSRGIFVWSTLSGAEERIRTRRLVPSTDLSWSPDGRCLTYGTTTGLIGKETRHYLHHLSDSRRDGLRLKYMTGLLLMAGVPLSSGRQ